MKPRKLSFEKQILRDALISAQEVRDQNKVYQQQLEEIIAERDLIKYTLEKIQCAVQRALEKTTAPNFLYENILTVIDAALTPTNNANTEENGSK